MNQECGIYRIVNLISERTYIGSSIDVKARMKFHARRLERGIHGNKHLQASWNKHGRSTFIFEHLISCDKVNLVSREQLFMDAYIEHGLKLFNAKPSFQSRLGFQYQPSPETIRKIANANTGKKRSPEFCAAIKARLSTPEWKTEHSARISGIPRPIDVRQKISLAQKGRKHNADSRRNMSAAHRGPRPYRLGFTHSDETKKKISLAKKGCIGYARSTETREKIRRRFKGIPLSSEHKAKLKAAWIIRRQRGEASQ